MSSEYRDRQDVFAASALTGLLASGALDKQRQTAARSAAAGSEYDAISSLAHDCWAIAKMMMEAEFAEERRKVEIPEHMKKG